MFRKLFSAIGRALRAAFGFPFKLLGSLFCGGGDDGPLEEVIEMDAETDGIEEVAEVKRWLAAKLSGRPAPLCGWRVHGWLRALDRECVEKLSRAALAGRLRGHLQNTQRIQGIPPVGSFQATADWIKARDEARRTAARRAGVHTSPDDAVSPRTIRPQPSPLAVRGLRDGRRAMHQPSA